jgi:hypothetical protein
MVNVMEPLARVESSRARLAGILRIVLQVLAFATLIVSVIVGWSYYRSGSLALVLPYLSGERLLIDPMTVVIESPNLDGMAECKIRIVNVTGKDVSLFGAEKSCGCIKLGELPFKIASGQSRELPIKVNVEKGLSNFRQSVKFFTDDSDLPNFTVTIRGVVRA